MFGTKSTCNVVLGLKNLDMLILAHNQMKYVPARVFANLSVLNSLELDGNHIIAVDDEAFYGLEGKQEDLKMCRIQLVILMKF